MIDRFGLSGALCLKFGAVSLVLIICETIGRRQYRTGRQLASFAIAIYLLPVAVALTQMATSPKTRAEYWEQTDEALPAEISGVSSRGGEPGAGNERPEPCGTGFQPVARRWVVRASCPYGDESSALRQAQDAALRQAQGAPRQVSA
ncbi:MAG: hypothetical protein V3T70_05520 [Phycisphaerae bacterium]